MPYLKNRIKIVGFHSIKLFSSFKTVLSLFLPTIAIQIYTVFDKTMIGVITQNPFENGYYEQSSKIIKLLIVFVTSVGTVVAPRIGYYYNKNDDISLKNLLYKSYRFVLMIAIPMTLGLLAISSNVIPWFLGNEFNKSIILTQILAFLMIFIGISNVTGLQYMVPVGKQSLLTISVVCGAIINFCLNIFLINLYKSIGAAIASIIAELFIALIQLYFVRSEISILRIFSESYKYIIAGIIMLIVMNTIVVKKFTPSILNSIILSIIGDIIYFSSLIVLKDKLIIKVIQKGFKIDD